MISASKSTLLSVCYITIFSLLSMRPSYADDSVSYPAIIADDFKYEATAPSRWDSQDWQNIGWAALAVAGTSIVADAPVRDFMRRQTPGNSFLNNVENFGQVWALGVMGGFYAAGLATGSDKSVQVAEDLLSASMISATINQTFKVAVNRYRPRDDQGTVNLQGYTGLNNNSSFPSGHTTEAFTLASVIASSYEDDPWVGYTVYSIAGMVGIARMYLDAHWASDVVASTFIGTWVGKSVVSHNRSLRGNSKNKVAILPDIAPGYTGVRVVGEF